jgi:hypothetical protein
MIDHLLTFPDEATAQTDLPQFWMAPSADGPGGWRGDLCNPGLSVYAVVDGAKQAFPGWYIWISLPALDPTLTGLSGNACRIATDYDAWARVADGWTWAAGDKAWIVYEAPDLAAAIAPLTIAEVVIEPAFAREKPYPFGGAA